VSVHCYDDSTVNIVTVTTIAIAIVLQWINEDWQRLHPLHKEGSNINLRVFVENIP